LWNKLKYILSSKALQVLVVSLVSGGAVFFVVKYIEDNAKQEILLQERQQELEIWERTKDATDSSPDNTDDALEYLRDRSD